MRVLVDTNVFVSAAITLRRPTSAPASIFRRWQAGAFGVLICPAILSELYDIQRRPYFAKPSVASTLAGIVALLTELAEVVPDSPLLDIEVRDPNDAAILAAAHHGQADFLVTGDEDLLVLSGLVVPVTNPATFLALLKA
jgi:uncharacterized protein